MKKNKKYLLLIFVLLGLLISACFAIKEYVYNKELEWQRIEMNL